MRRLPSSTIRSACALALLQAACSSDSGPGGGGTDGVRVFDGKTVSYETEGAVCDGRAVRPTNDGFCPDDCGAVGTDCGRAGNRPIDSCCVLVGEPGKGKPPTLERTTETKKYSGTGPPDLSCLEPGGYPAKPGTPRDVTMKGVVDSFANGCDLVGVKVEVFRVKRTGDPATDGELGDRVGTPVVTDSTFEVVLEEVSKCVDDRKNRAYEYPGVPTETELVIRTSGATPQDTWRELYAYNVYIAPDDPDLEGDVYHRDVSALAEDDFATIPSVAIGRTIAAGNGAVGGEIHDCGNVRLQNARVDVSTPRVSLVYFNSSEDNPLPDLNRDQIGTGRTALYSALDVKPGFVRISATGLVPDGEGFRLVTLGYADARVFPDSVTSVSLRGLRPFQVP